MKIKIIALGIGALICTAVLTSALVIGGYSYLYTSECGEETQGGNARRLTRWLASKPDDVQDVQFVEIKNIIVTLKGEGNYEHYLQLELALTTYNDEDFNNSEAIIPAIRGSTVAALSNRDYAAIRSMSVADLRASLMKEYQQTLSTLNVSVPFHDVVISKLVFQ